METFLEDVAAIGGPELVAELEAEFRRGWNVEKVLTELEMKERAEVSTTRTSGAVDGLGRVTMDIPATSYFYWLRWGRARGIQNIWKDETFRKDYARDNRASVVKYQSLKPFSGWTPEKEASGLVSASKYTRVREAAAAA